MEHTHTPRRSAPVRRSVGLAALIVVAALGTLVTSASPASALSCSDGGLGGRWYNPSPSGTVTDVQLGLVCASSEVYFNVDVAARCPAGVCYWGRSRSYPYGTDWLVAPYRWTDGSSAVYFRQEGSGITLRLHVYTVTALTSGTTLTSEDFLVRSS
jgi:hypothetical protein